MRTTRVVGTVLAVVIVVGLTGCASMGEKATAERTLYQRLGGREGIALVVDDFVATAVANPQIGERFKGLQPAQVFKLKSNLSDFICDATSGPCAYVGRDMKTVHTGMKLTDADWHACVDSLGAALDKNKVPEKEKVELLGALGPLMKDIVGQ
jgi:hemoglobin